MTKKIVSLALIAILMMALFLPGASAMSTMFVYTENGRSLNVRSAPVVGDNQIGCRAVISSGISPAPSPRPSPLKRPPRPLPRTLWPI